VPRSQDEGRRRPGERSPVTPSALSPDTGVGEGQEQHPAPGPEGATEAGAGPGPTQGAAETVATQAAATQAAATQAGQDDTCSFDDCACTGKNLMKFTSPAALLAVAEKGALSGYDIVERLRSMPLGGESGPDPGGLYRVLRRMERFNLLSSEWDTTGTGPARRLYRLTHLGDRCLDQWAETLRSHSQAVESFLADFARLREAERQNPERIRPEG
jgi:PadR family transcriptional regulator, regulatory protein PadR